MTNEKKNENLLKLEVGKRYVRRDGDITAPLLPSGDQAFPFCDPCQMHTYTAEGMWGLIGTSRHDLIAEYVEPALQDGRIPLDWSKVKPGAILINGFGQGKVKEYSYREEGEWPHRVIFEGFHTWKSTYNEIGRFVESDSTPMDIIAMIPAPEPKKIKVVKWANVYDGGADVANCRKEADFLRNRGYGATKKRLACVRFEIEATEGEGL